MCSVIKIESVLYIHQTNSMQTWSFSGTMAILCTVLKLSDITKTHRSLTESTEITRQVTVILSVVSSSLHSVPQLCVDTSGQPPFLAALLCCLPHVLHQKLLPGLHFSEGKLFSAARSSQQQTWFRKADFIFWNFFMQSKHHASYHASELLQARHLCFLNFTFFKRYLYSGFFIHCHS